LRGGGRKKADRHPLNLDGFPSRPVPHARAPSSLSLVAKRRPWSAATITGRFHWQRALEGRHSALQRCSKAPNPCFEITRILMAILAGWRQQEANEQTSKQAHACFAGEKNSMVIANRHRGGPSREKATAIHSCQLPTAIRHLPMQLPVLLQSRCSTLQTSNEPAGATLPFDTNAQISRNVINRGFL